MCDYGIGRKAIAAGSRVKLEAVSISQLVAACRLIERPKVPIRKDSFQYCFVRIIQNTDSSSAASALSPLW